LTQQQARRPGRDFSRDLLSGFWLKNPLRLTIVISVHGTTSEGDRVAPGLSPSYFVFRVPL
jgi:hypothetical protein